MELPDCGGTPEFGACSGTTTVPVYETTPLAVGLAGTGADALVMICEELALGNILHWTKSWVFAGTATVVSVTFWDTCSGQAYVVAADA